MKLEDAIRIADLSYPVGSRYLQKAGGFTPLEMGYCGTWETVGTGDFMNNTLAIKYMKTKQNKIPKIIGKIIRKKPGQPVSNIIPATVWQRTA